MIITDIQRFCTGDGPGIRTTVFFKGCPLRCLWCHNPETQEQQEQILYTEKNCAGCGACVKACRSGAHVVDMTGHHFNRTLCNGCMACAGVCMYQGLKKVGFMAEASDIMDEVMRDVAFYGNDGGLTLSGGEPLMQPEGCIDLLYRAKKNGIATAVETSGFFDGSYMKEIVKYTDLFLWDFKDGNTVRHKKYTGAGNEKALRNLALANSLGANIRLRCILVKGVNMEADNYREIYKTYASLRHCVGIDLLPYHAYFNSKAVQLGRKDGGVTEWIPTKEDIEKVRKILRGYGTILTLF